MKKSNYLFIAVILSGLTIITACKKEVKHTDFKDIIENTSITKGDTTYSLSNEGFLSFPSKEKYIEIIENNRTKDSIGLIEWADSLGFNSLLKELDINDSLIVDYLLANLLSLDTTIKIENYIYKICFNIDSVIAMPIEYIEKYDRFVNNKVSRDSLIIYSIEYPILDQTKDMVPDPPGGGGGGGGGGGSSGNKYKDMAYVYYGAGNNYRLKCKLVYQHAGIYFSLVSKVKKQHKPILFWKKCNGYLWINYNATWKTYSGQQQTKKDECTSCYSITYRITKRLWEGILPLQSFNVTSTYHDRNYCSTREFKIYKN